MYVLVEHVAADGALVAGREIVQARQGLLHLADGVVAEYGVGGHPHNVVRIPGVLVERGGLEGNEDALVVRGAVVGDLGLGLDDADHAEAQAVDFDLLAFGRNFAEELPRGFRAQHGHPPL